MPVREHARLQSFGHREREADDLEEAAIGKAEDDAHAPHELGDDVQNRDAVDVPARVQNRRVGIVRGKEELSEREAQNRPQHHAVAARRHQHRRHHQHQDDGRGQAEQVDAAEEIVRVLDARGHFFAT